MHEDVHDPVFSTKLDRNVTHVIFQEVLNTINETWIIQTELYRLSLVIWKLSFFLPKKVPAPQLGLSSCPVTIGIEFSAVLYIAED